MNVALLGAGEPHFDGHLKTLQVLPEIETIHVWGDIVDAVEALEADRSAKVETVTSDLDDLAGASDDLFFAIGTTAQQPESRPYSPVCSSPTST